MISTLWRFGRRLARYPLLRLILSRPRQWVVRLTARLYRQHDGVAPLPRPSPLIRSKPGIPIIFLQVGDFLNTGVRQYTDIALGQASLASPDSDIFLLTDVERPGLPGVTQVPLGAHYRAALRFKALYRHTSVNDPRYELLCFTRWFYIRDFARQHDIARFCTFDTDVLLFSPVERFASLFGDHPAGNWSGANTISDLDALDDICGFLERIQQDRQLASRIVEKYGTLSDMTAFLEFGAANRNIFDQNDLPALGFDDNINTSFRGMFAMEGAVKSLTIGPGGMPLATRVSDGARVPFHLLHFQGTPAKRLMAKFAWDRLPAAPVGEIRSVAV